MLICLVSDGAVSLGIRDQSIEQCLSRYKRLKILSLRNENRLAWIEKKFVSDHI